MSFPTVNFQLWSSDSNLNAYESCLPLLNSHAKPVLIQLCFSFKTTQVLFVYLITLNTCYANTRRSEAQSLLVQLSICYGHSDLYHKTIEIVSVILNVHILVRLGLLE